MASSDVLVSIGLPVRNGEQRLPAVVRSVLAQDYGTLELVISDNASTDRTEEICRELARSDPRIVYHRQPENVGLINNFMTAIRLANGAFFRWIGDDDTLASDYVSRCLKVFASDERLILVTTQVAYETGAGITQTGAYQGAALAADDPVDRFAEILRLLNESHLLIDPLYGMMRRAVVATIPRPVILGEDELYAARIALAGPWGHVPEVLATRRWQSQRSSDIARKLGVPAWQARFATVVQCRELLRCVQGADLSPAQRRRASAAVARLYLRRHQRAVARRGRKLAGYAATLLSPRHSSGDPTLGP